jgi:hypothetical protein
MIGRVVVLGLVVMAIGCTPARIATLEPPPEAERSEVLVYRGSAFNAGGMTAIFGVDRNDYLKLGTDTYAELRLVPKTYEFFVRTNEADRPFRLTIELKQNDRRCLEAYPNPKNLMKVPLFFVGYWLGNTFLLKEVDCPKSDELASYVQVVPEYE